MSDNKKIQETITAGWSRIDKFFKTVTWGFVLGSCWGFSETLVPHGLPVTIAYGTEFLLVVLIVVTVLLVGAEYLMLLERVRQSSYRLRFKLLLYALVLLSVGAVAVVALLAVTTSTAIGSTITSIRLEASC